MGKFTPIKKLKLSELKEEVQMWRNIWQWVPTPIKYYVSRTGQQIGIQVRNYKRYVGVLLDTTWELQEIEIGVYDKVYDQVTGEHFFERKICKMPIGQIVAFDWIAERKSEAQMEQEAEQDENGKLV